MRLNGIRAFLMRELENAKKEADGLRAQRVAMAASIAGLRAELAMLENGGPQDLKEVTQQRLAEVTHQFESFEREVFGPAEERRARATLRSRRFEAFVERVLDEHCLLSESLGGREPVVWSRGARL